jgi:hypothetical protein
LGRLTSPLLPQSDRGSLSFGAALIHLSMHSLHYTSYRVIYGAPDVRDVEAFSNLRETGALREPLWDFDRY